MITQLIANQIADGNFKDAKLIEQQYKAGRIKGYPGSIETENWLSKFLSVDPDIEILKDMVRLCAQYQDNALILGETGTGKELIARALHGIRDGLFIPINCTGLPDYLLESELFGHVKGSFTGALADKQGILLEADRGSVFFDEIGDMPMIMQAKILRVLQDRRIRPVGANREMNINCRFVFATNRNIETLIKSGDFREDLYYRISTITLSIKPLRERTKQDFILLRDSLDNSKQYQVDENYAWPGNVRELQKVVRQWQISRQCEMLRQ